MLLSRLGRTHGPSGPRQPPTHVERFSSFAGNSPPAAALECGMETMEHGTRFADDWRAFSHWVPVPGFEGWYSVNLVTGDVRRDRSGRILVPGPDGGGYLKVTLSREGESRTLTVHRLVCEAARGPRPAGRQVRHLDGDRVNNHWTNLVWGTPRENQLDRKIHGTSGGGRALGEMNANTRISNSKAIDAQMRYILHMTDRRENGFVNARRGFVSSMAEELGMAKVNVYMMVNGRSWKAQYAEARERLGLR